jgi:DNA-directed RNA polymerase specialized sigma subunit
VNLNDIFATNDSTDAIDNKLDAQKAIEKLGHIDRAILYYRAWGFTQAEIGRLVGYSQQRISQILFRISKKP